MSRSFNQQESSVPHQDINPNQVVADATGYNKSNSSGNYTNETTGNHSNADSNDTGILNTAKKFFGSNQEETNADQNLQSGVTNNPSGSAEIPQESYGSKASKGVSNAFSKVTGGNAQTTGHYKKVTNVDQHANATEGNVIEPNDNANVKYKSMVDAVITPEDVENAKLIKKGPHHDKTTTSSSSSGSDHHQNSSSVSDHQKNPSSSSTHEKHSSSTIGAGVSGVSTDPLAGQHDSVNRGTPAAAQAVGANNAKNDDASANPTPQGVRIEATRDAIPSTSQSHYREGVGEDYNDGSNNTAKSTAGGGIIGGIIGAVTGRSNSSSTGTSSNYDSSTKDPSATTTGGAAGGTTTGTTTGTGTQGKRSGLNRNNSSSSASSSDYEDTDHQDARKPYATQSSYQDGSTTSGNNPNATYSGDGGSGNAASGAAGGGVIGGIIGAVTGRGSNSSDNSNSKSQNAGGFSSEAARTTDSSEYANPNRGQDEGFTAGHHHQQSSGAVPGGFPETTKSDYTNTTAGESEIAPEPNSQDSSSYRYGESSAPQTNAQNTSSYGYGDSNANTSSSQHDHSRAEPAAAGAASGGILGGIISKVTGHGTSSDASTNDAYQNQSSGTGTGNANEYGSNASVASVKDAPGAQHGQPSSGYGAGAGGYEQQQPSSGYGSGTTGGLDQHSHQGTRGTATGAATGAAVGAGGAGIASGHHHTTGSTQTQSQSTGFANASTEQQEREIHELDYDIAAIEKKIKTIENEVEQLRLGSQNTLNAKEHEFSDANYSGGAALAEKKKAIDSVDTAAYGSSEKELSNVRAKQSAASKRLQELELERQNVVGRAQAIDFELRNINASINNESRDIDDLSSQNRDQFSKAQTARTFKNGPVPKASISNKKELEINALEDRVARLKIQADDLDTKINSNVHQSSTNTGGFGKTEQGYNDQSLSSGHGHTGAGVAAGSAAGLGAGAAAGSHHSKDQSTLGKTERGVGNDTSGNYQSIKSGHGSTAPYSGQQPHKFPETLRDQPKGKTHGTGVGTGVTGGTAAGTAAGAHHSAEASNKRRSYHESENSVYPDHENSSGKHPTEELVTGSGATSSQHRQPYGYAGSTGNTKSNSGNTSSGGTSGAAPAAGGAAPAVGAQNFSQQSGQPNQYSSTGGASSTNAQQGGKQVDVDKAGAKVQKLVEKIPGMNKKQAAGVGAAVAGGAVAHNAVMGGSSREAATQEAQDYERGQSLDPKAQSQSYPQQSAGGSGAGAQTSGQQFDHEKFGQTAGKGLEGAGVDSKYAGTGGTAIGAGAGYVASKHGQSGTGNQGTTQSSTGQQGSSYPQQSASGSNTGAQTQSSGQQFDHKKFGQTAGKGLEGAGVDSKYAGTGGTAIGAGAGYVASKHGQSGTANQGTTQSSTGQQGSSYPEQSGAQTSSNPQQSAGGSGAGAQTSGQQFDHKKFGQTAGKGLEGAGVDSKYAGTGGTAIGAGAGYVASKHGQSGTGNQGATQASSGQQFDHKQFGQTAGKGLEGAGVDSKYAGAGGTAIGAGAGYAASKYGTGHQGTTQSSDHHGDYSRSHPDPNHNRSGPAGAPYDPSYTDHEQSYATNPQAGKHTQHSGPAGAPSDPSYISGDGVDLSKTAATDSGNNVKAHQAQYAAAGAGAVAGAAYGADSHHGAHHNREGPAGAPYDSSYTDHEDRYASNPRAGNHPHHTGPAGAPKDQSFTTGDGDDYSKTAATDSANNIGRHQASKYPNGSGSQKHTGGAGPGAVGGATGGPGAGGDAAVAAAAAATAAGPGSPSRSSRTSAGTSTTADDASSDSSLKKKIQSAFKIGGGKNKDKGQLHGTTYNDPNYNANAYQGRKDTTYNTGDENLGDPQHPNTQQLGGGGGTLGGGILSPEERERYQVAQGEKSGTGSTGQTYGASSGARDSDYYDPKVPANQTGHGTGTKVDPRTGKDVTGSATQANNLNREAAIGAAGGAGLGAAGGVTSTHKNQTGYGTQGSTQGGTAQTAHQPGAAVGGSQKGDEDFIDIKVVGAQDKTEAAAIAAAVIKENRHKKGTFTSNEVVVDADDFKQTHGRDFMNTFSQSDKAVVEQMEHAAGATHGVSH